MKSKPSQRANKPLTKKKLLKQKTRKLAASAVDAPEELDERPPLVPVKANANNKKSNKFVAPSPAPAVSVGESNQNTPSTSSSFASSSSAAPAPQAETSRVILKNIPAYITRERLVERF